MEILGEIAALVEQGKKDAQSNYPRQMKGQPGVREKVEEALRQGIEPMRILNEGLTPGMRALGKKFAEGQIFVPEVLMAAKAMNAGVELLRPLLQQGDVTSRGTVVMGTVQGD
ncbi:MAG: B12-binding domain-containing protein, partial [bacterium]